MTANRRNPRKSLEPYDLIALLGVFLLAFLYLIGVYLVHISFH